MSSNSETVSSHQGNHLPPENGNKKFLFLTYFLVQRALVIVASDIFQKHILTGGRVVY